MDRGTISTLHVFPHEETEETNLQVQKQLETFILEFRLDNIFVYRYGANLIPWPTNVADLRSIETNCARMPSCKDITVMSTSAT